MATVKYFITSEDKSQSGLASAKKGLEQLGKESEKTGATGVKQFDLMGAALKGGLILAIGAATKAIVDFGKASVESFRVNEPIMIRLAAAARNAGSSFSEMSGFLAELGKTTLTTGTELQNLAAKYLQLGRSEEEVKKLMEASVLLSNVTGQSLDSAMTELNKTLEGSTGRIGLMIPGMSDLTEEQLRSGGALELLNERLGDYKGLLDDTLAQRMVNFGNAIDGLQTAFGDFITEAMDPVIKATTTWINKLTEAITKANLIRGIDQDLLAGNLSASTDPAILQAQIDRVTEQIQRLQRGRSAAASSLDDPTVRIPAYDDMIDQFNAELRGLLSQQRIQRLTIDLNLDPNGGDHTTTNTPRAGNSGTHADGPPIAVLPAIDFISEYDRLFTTLRGALTPLTELGTNSGAMADFAEGLISRMLDNTNNGYSKGSTYTPATEVPNPNMMAQTEPTGMMAVFEKLGPVIEGFAGGLAGVIGPLSSVQMILNPLQVVFQGIMDVLGPLIDQALAPLLGILTIFGQFIGQILAPVFKILALVIEPLAKIFVWFHNKIMKPIGNALITLIGTIWNGIANAINFLLGWLGVHLNTMDIGASMIQDISTEQVSAVGASTISSGSTSTGGTAAQYTGGQNYVVNVIVNTSVLTGDNGFEQLAQRLKVEIARQTALGY